MLENKSVKEGSKTTEKITEELVQTTLLDFAESDSTCSTSASGEDPSLKHVLCAISALSLKIHTISDQHKSLEHLENLSRKCKKRTTLLSSTM